MSTIEVTQENFTQTIQSNEFVVLDFWAPWCQPCIRFNPIFERVSNEYSEVVFGKVETDSQQALAAMFGITSIPTLAVIREGVVMHLLPGSINGRELSRLVKLALSS